MRPTQGLISLVASGPQRVQGHFVCLWNQPALPVQKDLAAVDQELAAMNAHLEVRSYVAALATGFGVLPSLLSFGTPFDSPGCSREARKRWIRFLRLWQKASAWYGQITPAGSLDANVDLKQLAASDIEERLEVATAIASSYYTLANDGRGNSPQFMRNAKESVQEALDLNAPPSASLSGANSVAGSISLAMNQPSDAVECFETSLRLDETIGNTPASIGRHLLGLGAAEASAFGSSIGLRKMLEGTKICEASQHPGFSISGYLALSLHFRKLGDRDAAIDAVGNALKWLRDSRYAPALRYQRRLAFREARRLGMRDPMAAFGAKGHPKDATLGDYLDQFALSLEQGNFYAACTLAAVSTERLVWCLLRQSAPGNLAPKAMLGDRIRFLREQKTFDESVLARLDVLRQIVRNPAAHADTDALSENLTTDDLRTIHRWLLTTADRHNL